MRFDLFKKFVCLIVCLFTFVTLFGCNQDSKVIRVGASPAPHAEILSKCKDYIESKGYKLEIVEFSDYVLPNVGVSEGSLDANFFQHTPYLDSYNTKNNTNIVSVLKVHFEPLGLYAGKSNNLSEINNGATIGIPNDETNCARALLLLAKLGLITVDTTKGLSTTVKDIKTNPKNLEIKELEANQLPSQLPSFDFAIINGNYALDNNIVDKLITCEDKDTEAAQIYANILCVNSGNEDTEKTKLLIEALTQESIRNYISEEYNSIVIPVF